MVLTGKKHSTPSSIVTRRFNENPTPLRNMKPTDRKSVSTLKFPCTVCKKEVKDTDKAIECDCNRWWWHARCALITDKQYNALRVEDENFTMNWVCKDCLEIRPKSYQQTPYPSNPAT